ncbi:MAG: hypothetical protein ACRD0W_01600 [Acidimicrobiales bacterium]
MSGFEEEVRARLQSMADEIRSTPQPSRWMLRRARRRMVRSSVAVATTAALLVFGGLAGVQALERFARPSIPAGNPSVGTPAPTESTIVTSAPPGAVVYASSDTFGGDRRLDVVLTLERRTGTLRVSNSTGEEIDPPGLYVVRVDDRERVEATIRGARPIADGATETFDVELPPGMAQEDIKLVGLLFGADEFGELSPA